MTNLLLKIFVKNYQDISDQKVRKDYGLLASFFGLFTNLLLFIAKITLGCLLSAYSIITDAINNLSDFGNNLLGIVGVKLSAKPADHDHPYGHQRIEYIVTLIISVVIIGLALIMGYEGIKGIVSFFMTLSSEGKPPKNNMSFTMFIVSLTVLVVAILLKLLQSYFYFSLGKKIDSLPLKALGKDSRNDVLATFSTLVSLLISWFVSIDIDCFFTVAVAIFVIYSGIGIMKEAITVLIGQTPSNETVNSLVKLIQLHKDVLGIHDLSLHYYGQEVYGVIHVEVDAKKDILVSHELCDDIEKEALNQLGVHLTIHMDPIVLNDEHLNHIKQLVKQALQNYHQNLSIHDFHITHHSQYAYLEFDLVLPNNLNNEESHKEIEQYILSFLKSNNIDGYLLSINYDDVSSDFLIGLED